MGKLYGSYAFGMPRARAQVSVCGCIIVHGCFKGATSGIWELTGIRASVDSGGGVNIGGTVRSWDGQPTTVKRFRVASIMQNGGCFFCVRWCECAGLGFSTHTDREPTLIEPYILNWGRIYAVYSI